MSKQFLSEFAWVGNWIQKDRARQKWPLDQWQRHFFGLSKLMARLLRHDAAKEGLTSRADGSIYVAVLLEHWLFKRYQLDEIFATVENDAKARYQFLGDADMLRVRCCQGHSDGVGALNVDSIMTPLSIVDAPTIAIHGTKGKYIAAIQREGLSVMGRLHIHMATKLQRRRAGSDTFVYIRVAAAVRDGIKFLISHNGVLLTPGINGVLPPKYITGAHDKAGKITFGQVSVGNVGHGTPADWRNVLSWGKATRSQFAGLELKHVTQLWT